MSSSRVPADAAAACGGGAVQRVHRGRSVAVPQASGWPQRASGRV